MKMNSKAKDFDTGVDQIMGLCCLSLSSQYDRKSIAYLKNDLVLKLRHLMSIWTPKVS